MTQTNRRTLVNDPQSQGAGPHAASRIAPELGTLASPAKNEDSSPSLETVTIKIWSVGRLSDSLTRQLGKVASNHNVVRVAVMPDVHEGPVVPNGCVVATRNVIYPQAVGKDIGCGVSAIRFNVEADDLSATTLRKILSGIRDVVPSLKLPKQLVANELGDQCPIDGLSDERLMKIASRDGLYQIGTLGRGNHFVELQRDLDGRLWTMVHTGSRGMGEAITNFHLDRANDSSPGGLKFLDMSERAGQAYYEDMVWATKYASESRLRILNRVADLVELYTHAQVDESSYVDSPHNFARVEEHFGERLIVHRKSANSASDGELGIIPGSMGTESRIVSGRGSAGSLRSSSHGAGRAMSRGEALDSIRIRDLTRMMDGIVYQEGLADKLRDEAPAAYKNLNEVMRAQRDLVRGEVQLSTILNYKCV